MFKKEMKANFKSFIIWSLITIAIFLLVYLIYPAITNSENIKVLDEMMKVFPEEILKAFNMDISSLDSAYGWLKSEGFIFVLLIIGSYSGILGSNILLKEETNKTIEYLNSLPIKRSDILFNKALVGLIYIILMVISVGLFNFFGLLLSGDFNIKQYLILSITPLFSSIVIYFLCLYIATFTTDNKKMFGISLGIVLGSYFLNALSMIADKVEFLKYFSIFTLADIRNVIINGKINPLMIIISLTLSIILLILAIIHYDKKELV